VQPLLEDSASLQRVESVIRRVGARMNPDVFIETISLAYQKAQAEVMPDLDMPSRFREGDSYADFVSSLTFALRDLGRPVSALVIGCGRGFAGCASDYAASVLHEVGSHTVKAVDTLELTAQLLDQPKEGLTMEYDLVITHSVAHFVPSLEAFFRYIRARVSDHGAFVLGHEPNAAFWNNPQIAALRDRRRRQLKYRIGVRKLLSPSSYLGKLKNADGAKMPISLTSAVNTILRSKFALRRELTSAEIAAFVDPHLPTNSSFRVGQRGLDAALIAKNYLPGWALLKLDTSEYPSLNKNDSIKQRLPGSIFSAVFRRPLLP
jgi:hypothetical protein